MSVRVPAKRVSGPALRRARLKAGVTGIALARQMGVRQQRVSQIEALVAVTPESATRYVAGLAAAVRERDAAR